EVTSFLDQAIAKAKAAPRAIITDQGVEFGGAFRRWCRMRGIRPRHGAVGEHGSIAIVERFIRSVKSECTRRIIVPFHLPAMRSELGCYAPWFNEHRPHEGLHGRTPLEVYSGRPPANEAPRFEPRDDWPQKARCAAPSVPVSGKVGARLVMTVGRLERRAHLPIVTLRRTA
ncbi:MAG: transposase, partial [Myxococcales bacterium]|nr:transposase [Myxococcales bacterium]